MKYCLCDGNGRITSTGYGPDSMTEHSFQTCSGTPVLNIPLDVDASTHYREGAEFAKFPERPSEFHTWDWSAKEWQANAKLAETSVRAKRDALLSASDWTQLPDAPLETKTAWAAYRKELRDLTDQAGFPLGTTWPSAPNNNGAEQ